MGTRADDGGSFLCSTPRRWVLSKFWKCIGSSTHTFLLRSRRWDWIRNRPCRMHGKHPPFTTGGASTEDANNPSRLRSCPEKLTGLQTQSRTHHCAFLANVLCLHGCGCGEERVPLQLVRFGRARKGRQPPLPSAG